MSTLFTSVTSALEELRQGRMIVLVDDERREQEGDLMVAADKVTPEVINFMAKYARGLICLPMAGEILDRLELPLMPERNKYPNQAAFTVSIEAACGVTTGVSAADRAQTLPLDGDRGGRGCFPQFQSKRGRGWARRPPSPVCAKQW